MNRTVSTLLNYSGVVALIVAGAVALTPSLRTSEKVAVIDVEKVKTEAMAFKKINAEAEKYISALKARAGEDEKTLQAEASALKKRIDESGKQVSDFAKEISAINQKVTMARNKVQVQSQLIAKATQSALMQINPVTEEALKEFSAQKGITIILPKSVITYNTDSVDVTADFIQALNKKSVNVIYPNPAQFTTLAPGEVPVQSPNMVPATAAGGISAGEK